MAKRKRTTSKQRLKLFHLWVTDKSQKDIWDESIGFSRKHPQQIKAVQAIIEEKVNQRGAWFVASAVNLMRSLLDGDTSELYSMFPELHKAGDNVAVKVDASQIANDVIQHIQQSGVITHAPQTDNAHVSNSVAQQIMDSFSLDEVDNEDDLFDF